MIATASSTFLYKFLNCGCISLQMDCSQKEIGSAVISPTVAELRALGRENLQPSTIIITFWEWAQLGLSNRPKERQAEQTHKRMNEWIDTNTERSMMNWGWHDYLFRLVFVFQKITAMITPFPRFIFQYFLDIKLATLWFTDKVKLLAVYCCMYCLPPQRLSADSDIVQLNEKPQMKQLRSWGHDDWKKREWGRRRKKRWWSRDVQGSD